MYMLYLITALTISSGIGAMVIYDKERTQTDMREDVRMEVSTEQQLQLARSLRRQFYIDPTRFPTVAPGEYARIDDDMVGDALISGYLNASLSDFYISGEGDIIGIMVEGRLSPFSRNGDASLGVTTRPQFLANVLEEIVGNDALEGRFGDIVIPPGYQETYDNTNDRSQNANNTLDQTLELPDTIQGQTIQTLPRDVVVELGHLDMDMIGYHEAVAQTPTKMSSRYSLAARNFSIRDADND